MIPAMMVWGGQRFAGYTDEQLADFADATAAKKRGISVDEYRKLKAEEAKAEEKSKSELLAAA